MSGIVAFHLGAGTHSEKNKLSYKRLCVQTSQKVIEDLSSGQPALDIVTKCTTLLENSPLTNAGIGSNLTSNGTVECDASVMDGARCLSGAVGAVSGLPNPVLVAKSLAIDQTVEQPCGRVLPCILVGEGALMYASERGIPTTDPSSLITPRALKSLKKCKRKLQASNSFLQGSVIMSQEVGERPSLRGRAIRRPKNKISKSDQLFGGNFANSQTGSVAWVPGKESKACHGATTGTVFPVATLVTTIKTAAIIIDYHSRDSFHGNADFCGRCTTMQTVS